MHQDRNRAFVEQIQSAIASSDVDQEYVKRTLLVELAKDLKHQGHPVNGLIKMVLADDRAN